MERRTGISHTAAERRTLFRVNAREETSQILDVLDFLQDYGVGSSEVGHSHTNSLSDRLRLESDYQGVPQDRASEL